MEFKEIEMEVLGLWIATEALDSMVNHALLKLLGREDPKEVHFKNHIHQKLFSILLLDFLEKVDYQLTNVKGSCLDLLEKICHSGSFNEDGSIEFLEGPLGNLKGWLETEIPVETFFPSIEQTLTLRIKRKDSLYICGNISKHNVSRLTGAGRRLSGVLKENDVSVDSNSNKILHLQCSLGNS